MASIDDSETVEISKISGQLTEDLVQLSDLVKTSKQLVDEMADLVANADLLVEGKQLQDLWKTLKDLEDDARECVVDAKRMRALVNRHLNKPQP